MVPVRALIASSGRVRGGLPSQGGLGLLTTLISLDISSHKSLIMGAYEFDSLSRELKEWGPW
jgi:hypothetical protein